MKQFSLEKYLANPSRKLVTRDGRNARIICTDRRDLNYPIITLIETGSGEEMAYSHTKDGEHCVACTDIFNLFFASENQEGWMNIYRDSDGNRYVMDCPIFTSKEEAEKKGKRYIDYITTIKIEWEE